ncbi:hypothetical protein JCM19236_5835 [Vibrio sp. JCM 19236]|nr:hypothetical protein JCM19236_5835 [Vibrio sp. JCM 19236]
MNNLRTFTPIALGILLSGCAVGLIIRSNSEHGRGIHQ